MKTKTLAEKLLFISQLELLYKSCMHTLRAENIEIDQKHEILFDAMPDHDAIDLSDTIEILHELILQDDDYKEIKVFYDLTDHAKQYIINVESLDVLEEQLNFTELEQEMGTEIILNNSLHGLISELYFENDIATIEDLDKQIKSEQWKLKLYYAENDKQYVAVFS